jgi:hypothetical protein
VANSLTPTRPPLVPQSSHLNEDGVRGRRDDAHATGTCQTCVVAKQRHSTQRMMCSVSSTCSFLMLVQATTWIIRTHTQATSIVRTSNPVPVVELGLRVTNNDLLHSLKPVANLHRASYVVNVNDGKVTTRHAVGLKDRLDRCSVTFHWAGKRTIPRWPWSVLRILARVPKPWTRCWDPDARHVLVVPHDLPVAVVEYGYPWALMSNLMSYPVMSGWSCCTGSLRPRLPRLGLGLGP